MFVIQNNFYFHLFNLNFNSHTDKCSIYLLQLWLIITDILCALLIDYRKSFKYNFNR